MLLVGIQLYRGEGTIAYYIPTGMTRDRFMTYAAFSPLTVRTDSSSQI